MPSDFDDILNSTANRVCLIAVPGCGKTKGVLIPKLEQLLGREDIEPEQVLVLTFSRLSALDLKERVAGIPRTPRAATVHSFALSFLISENNHEIRNRIDSIILDFEKAVLISDLRLLFPGSNRNRLKKDLDAFSAGWATEPHDQVFEEDDARRAFKQAVVNWLSEHEAAMMEEIIYHAVDLGRHLDSAPHLDAPRYILVDEFQDLNRLEQEFIERVARDSEQLLVLGDPDQSIYSFKYAHRQGITDFAAGDGVEAFSYTLTRRCAKSIAALAAQLLRQADPARTELIDPAPAAPEGEVHLVRKNTQDAEFKFVFDSILGRLESGARAKDIIVLVPRKKLGREFEKYARTRSVELPTGTTFAFVQKPEFGPKEQERLLLLALHVNPDSLLHARCYLGLGDSDHFARELAELKSRYGNLGAALANSVATDFPPRKRRLQQICGRLVNLRESLAAIDAGEPLDVTLDRLLPSDDESLGELRAMFDRLREEDDTLKTLYEKFLDYMRTVPTDDNTVRLMTLMASKGLDADHVYIVGCNAGNLPGSNRSVVLTDYEHREEQRRLLYVGFTRAKQSLTVSWSRHVPFGEALSNNTQGVGQVRIGGKLYTAVGLSEFLQHLAGVTWET